MSNLDPDDTGIDGVMIYLPRRVFGHHYLNVPVGGPWEKTDRRFALRITGQRRGHWMNIGASHYRYKHDAPAEILRDVRAFIELNVELLAEWSTYEGMVADHKRFTPRVRSIKTVGQGYDPDRKNLH